MATINGIVATVASYGLAVALLAFALAAIAVWSRRDMRIRYVAVALASVVAYSSWFAFSELPGRPKEFAVAEFKKKYWCTTIVHAEIKRNVGLYLLVREDKAKEAEYIFVQWNMKLATSLQRGMRIAALNSNGSLIYGGKACMNKGGKKGNGDRGSEITRPGDSGTEGDGSEGEFIFHPRAVPALPEKNYGPTFESPLELPSR